MGAPSGREPPAAPASSAPPWPAATTTSHWCSEVVAAVDDHAGGVGVAACLQLGNLLRILGEYRRAEALLTRADAAANQGTDLELQAVASNALGILCKDTGRYDEAERHYERARVLLRTSGHSGGLASLWHNIAGLAYTRGAHAEGERAARRAIEIRENVVGREPPDVAADVGVLAVLVAGQGRFGEAEALHERALAIWRRIYGSDHYEVAVNLNGLAALLQQRGDHRGAEELQHVALAIKERVLGPKSPRGRGAVEQPRRLAPRAEPPL